MTDAGAPLSRRERRERERRNAAPEFDDLATGETEARGGDGRALSRRERRALERTMHPMETWTAEEEMLATGQLPAMTPEVIAAEERNARERAEQAALEAEATSSELRRADIERESALAEQGRAKTEAPERLSTALPSPAAQTAAPEPAAPEAPQSAEPTAPAQAFAWPEPQAPAPVAPPAAATREPFTWPSSPQPAESAAPSAAEPETPAWPDAGTDAVLPQPSAQEPAPVAEPAVTPPAEHARPRFTGLSRPTPESAPQSVDPAEADAPPADAALGDAHATAQPVSEPFVAQEPEAEAPVAEPFVGESPASEAPVAEPFVGEAYETEQPVSGDLAADQAEAIAPDEAESDAPAEPWLAGAAAAATQATASESDAGALPDVLKDLFPAGSPQARMMEEGAAYARAQAEHPVARTPIPLPDAGTPEGPASDGESAPHAEAEPQADAAYAGFADVEDQRGATAAEESEAVLPEVAQPQAVPAEQPVAVEQFPAPAQQRPEPSAQPTSQAPRAEDPAAEMRRLADEAMANLMNAGTSLDSHTVDDAARAAGEAVAESRGEVAPHDRELPDALFHDAPATPTPAAAQPFVNLHGDSSTTQVLPPVAPFGQSAVEPAESATGTAAPSWEQGNLQPATPAGFNPDDYVPSSDIPLPDLSALEQAAHPNTASGANGSGEIPYVAAPVTDGIEVPRREVPQLQPGHGARDMHWAHFLVIGAVAFVLGLLVYQLAGLGS